MRKDNRLSLTKSIAALVLLFTIALMGCTPAKKPAPSPGSKPRVITEPRYLTRNPAGTVEETNGLNNKLSAAVSKIKDIKKASVIVIGSSAYAGIDVQPNIDKARLEAIRPRVASVIETTEPRVTTVFTATRPGTINKIDRVRAAIRAKKPSSSYASDLRLILSESDLVR